jgi:hypothetical protein
MPSSGILRRVALVSSDIAEECVTFIIRATRIGELGKTLAVTSNQRTLRRNTYFTDSCHHDDGGATFLQPSVLIRATRRNIPEDGILRNIGCLIGEVQHVRLFTTETRACSE